MPLPAEVPPNTAVLWEGRVDCGAEVTSLDVYALKRPTDTLDPAQDGLYDVRVLGECTLFREAAPTVVPEPGGSALLLGALLVAALGRWG